MSPGVLGSKSTVVLVTVAGVPSLSLSFDKIAIGAEADFGAFPLLPSLIATGGISV